MRTHPRARAGFTLAEMLMAVAIIAVLIALSAAAIFRFRDTGPYNASVANLSRLQSALDTQWQAVRDRAMRDSIHGFKPSDLGVSDLADAAARQNYVNMCLVQAFPISFEEALVPTTGALKAYAAYETYLRKILNAKNDTFAVLRSKAQKAASPQVQQAVCLMMIVEAGPSNAGLTADKLEGGMVQRLDPIGTNGIVDGWGRPVLFTRGFQPFSGPKKANQLVLVSIGAIRGNTQPWERVKIDGVPAIPPNTPWPAGTPWTPNSNNHTLKPQDSTMRDITDEVVTTYKP